VRSDLRGKRISAHA